MMNAKVGIGRISRSVSLGPSVERAPSVRSVVTDIPVLRAMVTDDHVAPEEIVMTIEAEPEQ